MYGSGFRAWGSGFGVWGVLGVGSVRKLIGQWGGGDLDPAMLCMRDDSAHVSWAPNAVFRSYTGHQVGHILRLREGAEACGCQLGGLRNCLSRNLKSAYGFKSKALHDSTRTSIESPAGKISAREPTRSPK